MQTEEKTVDIDTSGPGAEVEIPEEKTPETETETEIEVSNEKTDDNNTESNDSAEKSDEQPDVQAEPDDKEKKKELEEYSEGVKRRIAKLTRKMREAERREEAATAYAKSVLEKQKLLEGKISKLDTNYVSEMENRLKASMEAAVSKLQKAREDGNLQDEVTAQTEISRLGYEEAKLLDMKARGTEKEEPAATYQPEKNQTKQEAPINPDPKAQAWASKNEWFGKDEAMTYTAFALHKKLTEEEGYDAQSDEYYNEIDKRLKLEFPHKFGKVETPTTEKPTQTVASASRTSRTGRKVVRLTPSQMAIAKKLGVPLEEYAKQLITKE
jgi:hypothetical protein